MHRYLFNKPSEWTYQNWLESEACYLLNQIPCDVLEYIEFNDMTDEEKAAHLKAETTGGYLQMSEKINQRQEWYDSLSDDNKTAIKSIPNFDKDIFKDITGIDIDTD